MHIVCLDLEGVLVPEIWIAFAEATGIHELKRTTRDEPDYDKLMSERLAILDERGLKLADIKRVIATLEPLKGAVEFVAALRERAQLAILSDTFTQFADPLIKKLGRPTFFCNDLEVAANGKITGYRLRQKDGKMRAVEAFRSMNVKVFAAGDSYNDLSMIKAADAAALFRAPENVRRENPLIHCFDDYDELLAAIDDFVSST